jgi:ABC-type taurine transport system substrate-binding protein
MSYSQTITVSGTPQQTTVINSTRAKIAAQVSVFYAVGANPTAVPTASNTALMPAGALRDINLNGNGNKISLVFAGTAGNVTITQIGNVATPTGSV